MEGSPGEASASVEPSPSAEGPAGVEAEEPKRGGRFSRKKDKKKAAKKAKKASKHSKDKGKEESSAAAGADVSPSTRRGVQGAHGGVRSGVPSVQGDDANTGVVQREPTNVVRARDARGAAAPDPRRDSGIEDESYRHSAAFDPAAATAAPGGDRHPGYDEAVTLRKRPRHQAQDRDEGSLDPQRSKSRSRSGSRKRLSSLFRRRGRSGGRDDRTKSETDISGVVGDRGGPGLDQSSDEMKARNANSLDRAKGRHAALMDRDASARHSASLERDAYRRYDPTKQPRDRLMHMTVKDALTEYRLRHHTSASRLSSAERRRGESRRTRSVSETDVSQVDGSGREGGLDGAGYHLDPDQTTLVKTVATLPRKGRAPVRKTTVLGESPAGSVEHLQPPLSRQHRAEGGDASSERNVGEQILDLCRSISQGREMDRIVSSEGDENCDRNSTVGVQRREPARDIPRNTSSVIFINPSDIVGDTADSLPSPEDYVGPPERNAAAQQKVKPSEHFMELRRTVPLYSNSTAARARRISQSGDSSPAPRDPRTSQSRDSFESLGVPSSSSKGASSPSPTTIPIPGPSDKDRTTSPSRSGLESPTITVNYAQGTDTSVPTTMGTSSIMNTSLTMTTSMTTDTSMVSSIDSEKRSSDQGFFSEPRESDTESEADMSGFSTPPEEPESEHDCSRNSLSPTVFVNTVSHLLEVPRAKSAYKRTVSDGVRKVDKVDTPETSSPFNRSESSKSDSVLLRNKRKQLPPSTLEGGLLYKKQREGLRQSEYMEGKQERVEQKTVPVMGTSVQQKYRRTFSPVRDKGRDVSKEDNSSPTESYKEASSALALSEQPKPSQSSLRPSGERLSDGDELKIGDKEEREEGDTLRQGRDLQRRRGYVSSRSFRRKKEKENKEPEVSSKDEPKLDSPQQQGIIDDGIEELSYRIAFQDKSIQTSESLLNELIKNSKKRKVGLFSSNGKKSKRATPQRVTEIPVGLPPPRYEEERLVSQEADVDTGIVDGCQNVSSNQATDIVDGFRTDNTDDPEIAQLVEEAQDPAVEESQGENENTPKKTPPKSKGVSFRAIITLKQKLARNRKKRESKNKKNKSGNEENEQKVDDDLPSDTFITIENELNLSKLAEIKETDILDDEIFEPDFGPALPKKQLRFEPITSDEPIQSEEPLPPLSPASRRLTARRNSSRGRERRKKCLQCCKKFVAFLFSHIGLCSLVVGYTIMGGFVFRALESPHEKSVKTDIKKVRLELMGRIESLATKFQLNMLGRENLTLELEKEIVEYQKFIHSETTDKGWDGNEIDPTKDKQNEQWSFASALLYAITVMTTIGECWLSRGVCMF